MNWIDIFCIITACTAANHLGLVTAIERRVGLLLPVLGCVKCATFWCTLLWLVARSVCGDGIAATTQALPAILATSFLSSYLAIWLELGMAYIDTLYNRIYNSLYDKDNHEKETASEAAD